MRHVGQISTNAFSVNLLFKHRARTDDVYVGSTALDFGSSHVSTLSSKNGSTACFSDFQEIRKDARFRWFVATTGQGKKTSLI